MLSSKLEFLAKREKVGRVLDFNVWKNKESGTYSVFILMSVCSAMFTYFPTSEDINAIIEKDELHRYWAKKGANEWYNDNKYEL